MFMIGNIEPIHLFLIDLIAFAFSYVKKQSETSFHNAEKVFGIWFLPSMLILRSHITLDLEKAFLKLIWQERCRAPA
jgi:hypothetical protein